MSSFLKFSLILLAVLSLVFCLHVATLHALQKPLFENSLVAAYLFNYFFAIVIYLTLFLLRKKMSNQVGFLYMAGSFLKFIFFFIFFYPFYKMDGRLDQLEFAAFFIPYVVSLIFETLGVINFLKK